MPRGTEAKRHSLLLLMKFDLFRKIVDILSLVKRNILISPLVGEKKFLGELCELRNFREGYKKYKNADRATECAMTDVSDKKGKIKMNKNNLQQKQPNNPVDSPETNYSPLTIHHSLKRKVAFTLAEVLITLGIIGIVACLTMPMVIGNYQKKVSAEKLKKLYLNYENAVQLTEIQEGQNREEWRFATVEERRDFVYNKLIPNLNCQKVVDKLGNSSSRYSPICVLNDGGIIAFHEKHAAYLTSFELFFILDSNALKQNKILWGKNGFYYRMYVVSRNTSPTWGRANLLKECKAGIMAQKNSSSEKDFIDYESRNCIDLIRYDGWVISDDYPW